MRNLDANTQKYTSIPHIYLLIKINNEASEIIKKCKPLKLYSVMQRVKQGAQA